MKLHKNYAVLGLGRYGRAVADELVRNGAEVLCVDMDPETVEDAAAYLPLCKCADITDPGVLDKLGISNIDVAVIAMGGNFEASVMTAMLCKDAGVGEVIVKCKDEMHRKIMLKTGADKALIPEYESGVRLAKNLMSAGFIDMAEISDDVSVVELEVKKEWVGKSLVQLRLREKYSLNVVAVKNNGEVNIDIDPNDELESGARLIVVARTDKLRKLM